MARSSRAAIWAERAPRRVPITREQVVQQAVALLDEAGFDGLTMRRLADRLGIRAASLYNHVRDKDELLALVADELSGEIPDLEPGGAWREQLAAVARDYRRVLLGHRDAARVLAATLPLGPNRLRLIEQLLDVLCRAGFDDAEAADAAYVLNTYVVGFVLDETQALPADDRVGVEGPHDNVADALREQGERWYRELPPGRYPRLVALAEHLFAPTMEQRFEFGLTTLLDGLELRLARRHPRT
jgi:TetR/AcrR family tetracycline transcriptional repressor